MERHESLISMHDADVFAEKGAIAVLGAFEVVWLERLAEVWGNWRPA